MIDATLPVQAALVALLRGAAAVTALVGDRIYDVAPEEAAYPFISFGPRQALPFGNVRYDGCEVFVQLDLWSRKDRASIEGALLMAAVVAAIDRKTPAIAGWLLASLRVRGGLMQMDPDGVSAHGIVTARAVMMPSP